MLELLRRALADERGIRDPPAVKDDALEFLAARAGGDARTALSALELAAETVGPGGKPSRSRWPRTRSSAAPSCTTSRATSTTT